MGKKITDNFVYFVYGTIAGIRKLRMSVNVMIALMVEPPRLIRKSLFLIFWSGGFRKVTTGLTSWKQVFQQLGLTECECSVLLGAERLWLRNRCVVLVVQHHRHLFMSASSRWSECICTLCVAQIPGARVCSTWCRSGSCLSQLGLDDASVYLRYLVICLFRVLLYLFHFIWKIKTHFCTLSNSHGPS